MYNPKYTITDRVGNELMRIGELRVQILTSPIVPKRSLGLRHEAIIHNTHSSTAIEGNPLSLAQVHAVVDDKKVIGTKKDRQEVINYAKALEKIPKYAEEKVISESIILDIQKDITMGTLEKETYCGAYRDKQVFIGRRVMEGTQIKTEVMYMPPDTKEVPKLMKEFTEWLDSDVAREINPVLHAGIAHYELVRIHSFVDGNGRTARVLASLVLYIRDFDKKQIFPMDDYYWRDRNSYYNVLNTVHERGEDLTSWLEYYSEGIRVIMEELKDKIVVTDVKGGEQIELSPRQIRIIEYIKKEGKISNKKLREILGVSHEIAHRELRRLVEVRLIKEVGGGRSTHYILS